MDDVAVADTVAVAVAVADTVAVDIVVVDIVDCGIDVGSVVCQMTTDEGKMISYPKNGLFIRKSLSIFNWYWLFEGDNLFFF